MTCPYCHDDPSASINCYCRPVLAYDAAMRSLSITPRDDYWMVDFTNAVTTSDAILPWVNDNIGTERYFIKNYRTLGFYDREQAVLCHLRFA